MIPRSSSLLAALIETKEFTAEEIACHLLVSVAMLGEYVAATAIMPLSRQMLLARFVIAQSRSHKRAGHLLHAQVTAAVGFHANRTASHTGRSLGWPRRAR
jgi:hypothetical protein